MFVFAFLPLPRGLCPQSPVRCSADPLSVAAEASIRAGGPFLAQVRTRRGADPAWSSLVWTAELVRCWWTRAGRPSPAEATAIVRNLRAVSASGSEGRNPAVGRWRSCRGSSRPWSPCSFRPWAELPSWGPGDPAGRHHPRLLLPPPSSQQWWVRSFRGSDSPFPPHFSGPHFLHPLPLFRTQRTD